jgi:hypothetical protein
MLLHVIKKDFDDMGSESNSSSILEENLSKNELIQRLN